jgi:dTDP-4-dehydrorhamnose 3,5-epimerase
MLYREQEGLTCSDRARQSAIDSNEEHHSQREKSDEENRLRKVAAGQNTSSLTERGIPKPMGMTWCLPGARQDKQSVTKDWESVQPLIEGVLMHKMRNVMKDNGYLTEIFREEWEEGAEIKHIFQETLNPGEITAWHCHQNTTDRLFASLGSLKIVLYDARKESSTRGLLNVFRVGTAHPHLIVVPPGIWHGVMNIGPEISLIVNITDKVYEYESPDHWRLDEDTDQIPYSFRKSHRDSP